MEKNKLMKLSNFSIQKIKVNKYYSNLKLINGILQIYFILLSLD
jgi:hypothetical protein